MFDAPAKGRGQAAGARTSDLICLGRCDSMATFAAASITVIEKLIFNSMLRMPRRQ